MARLVKCEERGLTVLRYLGTRFNLQHIVFLIHVCIKTQDVLHHDSLFKSISVLSRCQQIGLELPCIYLFLFKGINQDPGYFLRKTCNPPQLTYSYMKGRRNNTIIQIQLYDRYKIKCFSWSLWIPQTKIFLSVSACCSLFWWSNRIQESYQANKQLFL